MRTSFRCSLLAKCHYAHRLPVSEGFAVTFIVMLSKSVDYVQPRTGRLAWRGETPSGRETPGGARDSSAARRRLGCFRFRPNVRHRTDRPNAKGDPDAGRLPC